MSDTQPQNPDVHSTAPNEDEEIIDLLEEVAQERSQPPISALERQLLGLDASDKIAADLSDLTDLVSLDLGQADNEDDKTEIFLSGGIDPDAASLSEEGIRRPALPENEMKEILELDKQAPKADDILEVERILGGAALEEKESGTEENEILELIEVEEEESDNEILLFDDLDQKIESSESWTHVGPAGLRTLDTTPRPGQETPAADTFSARVESALSDSPIFTATGAAATAAAFRPPLPSTAGSSLPVEPGAPASAPPALSEAEIEAAIERLIERKMGRTIESVIHQAIENAISKEIERLKRLLLENDSGTAP